MTTKGHNFFLSLFPVKQGGFGSEMSVKYDFHTVDGVMLLAEATWDAQKKKTFFWELSS